MTHTTSESRDKILQIGIFDGDYITAEAAEHLADLLGGEPHNPFNYQDTRFELIDASSSGRKQVATDLPETALGLATGNPTHHWQWWRIGSLTPHIIAVANWERGYHI